MLVLRVGQGFLGEKGYEWSVGISGDFSGNLGF